ncbi:MAG: CapA family protein, partial [Ardenticatenaceae bacterium]
FEEQGLLDTLEHLDGARIAHAGAGRDLEAAAAPAILEKGGLRVAVIAFTDNEPGWAATPTRPGTNYIEIRPHLEVLNSVEQLVRHARNLGAHVVILSLHWGPNMRQRPTQPFRDFAHAMLERGVDLIHGHSAHIFQGVEVYRNKLILYNTGDFIDDYRVDPEVRNDHSLIFLANIDEQGTHELRMIPVRLDYATVNLATGRERDEICRRMIALSAEFGTAIERIGDELHVKLRSG